MLNVGLMAAGSGLGLSGGISVCTRGLVEGFARLDDLGATITVLANADSVSAWHDRTWPEHIRIRALPGTGLPSIARRAWTSMLRRLGQLAPSPDLALSRWLERQELDLLHFPETIIQPRGVDIPCVLTVADIQQEYHPEFFTADELTWRRDSYRPSVQKATRVIVPSGFTRDSLVDKYAVPSGKIAVVPYGIADDYKVLGIPRPGGGLPGLPEDFIVYPANPWPHKNHARLMRALRLCRERHGQAPHLVCTGRLRGEARDVMTLALAAGVEDLVHDRGFVATTDMSHLYRAARFVVFPSLFEGFGLPVVEAMACGCPVVASRATAVPEVAGDAALLVDPLDPSGMADAIHAMWTDADLRASCAIRGRRRAVGYGWATMARGVMDAYRVVAAGGKRA